jgi:glutathione S-transferase
MPMLKFYCAPWSRASTVFWLLEELGQPYEVELVDIRAPGGVPESIEHDGTVVTERAAICIYLADAFPEAGLAPPIGDIRRSAYLTRLVYCDSVFDPAVAA